MKQPQLVPDGRDWPSEEEIAQQHAQLEAEEAGRQDAPAGDAQLVDTQTGEVTEAAAEPQPGTAVAVRSQAAPAPMGRHAAPTLSLDTYDKDMQIATALAKAQVFPAAKDAFKAYAAILIGRDLGMGHAEAMMNVEFGAQGKPVISVHWQAAQIRRAGHNFEIPVLSPTQCMVHFFRRIPGEGLKKVGQVGTELSELKKIAIHDKNQNGRATLGDKWNYRSWGEDMLYAFCMRRGMRRYYPELMLGYAGSEADDIPEVEFVDESGDAETVGAAQASEVLFGGERPDVGVR